MKRELRARIVAVLDKAAVDAAEIHLVDGLAERALPALVPELGASTLVLGALSRRWLTGFVVGNTAERIVHETTCDLLIVKPPGFKTRTLRARKEPIELPA